MKNWRRETILDIYQAALGLFLVLSPWLFFKTQGPAIVDAWVSGLAVTLIAFAAIVAFAEFEEWLNLLLGVWLIVSPWALRFTHTTAMHICIGVGILVGYLALLEIWLIHDASSSRQSSPKDVAVKC